MGGACQGRTRLDCARVWRWAGCEGQEEARFVFGVDCGRKY